MPEMGNRSKRAILLSTPTETLFEDVVAVGKQIGRAPKVSEYAAPGHHSYLALRRRFDGWRQVKKLVREKLSVGQRQLSHSLHWEVSHSAVSAQEAIKTFFKQSRDKGIL